MNIVVTGGAGYIGSRLAQELLNMEHNVIVYDSLIIGDANIENNNTIPLLQNPNITFIQNDIRNMSVDDFNNKSIDVMYHLAAISNDPTGNINPEETFSVNHMGTVKAYQIARELGVKLFVFASSSSVLGIQTGTSNEQTTPNPITPYSKSKLQAEEYLKSVSSKEGGPVVCIIRPATVYGVSQRQRFDLVMNALTGSAFFDKTLNINGRYQRRPSVTMTDLIRAYTHLLQAPFKIIHGEIFHVGNTNKTLGQMAEDIIYWSSNSPELDVFYHNPIDTRDYYVDSTKFEDMLNFRYLYDFEDTFHELNSAMTVGFVGNYKNPEYHNISYYV